MDLALNNLQWLICHKTQPNQTELYYKHLFIEKKHRISGTIDCFRKIMK